MITKSEFLEWLARSGGNPEQFSKEIGNFDDAAEAALKAWRAMPGIGFVSVASRMNCFLAVCRHLDAMIDDGYLGRDQAQTSLAILAIKDKKFQKAMAMFDMRCNRYGVRTGLNSPKQRKTTFGGVKCRECVRWPARNAKSEYLWNGVCRFGHISRNRLLRRSPPHSRKQADFCDFLISRIAAGAPLPRE